MKRIEEHQEKRILILAANPTDTDPLRLEREVEEIRSGLQDSRISIEFDHHYTVKPKDLQRHILRYRPHILHFSSHGEGERGILLEDNSGRSKRVSSEALENLFHILSQSENIDMQCVVFNACYSEFQAERVARHVPFVIGTTCEIEDDIAIDFSISFYNAIASGEDYVIAYELACNTICMEHPEYQTAPVMFTAHKRLRPRVPAEREVAEPGLGATSERSYSSFSDDIHGLSREIRKKASQAVDLMRAVLPPREDLGDTLSSDLTDDSPFINRTKEMEHFLTDIVREREENRVILLHAPSGVGKSALTSAMISRITDRLCIKISVPQHSSSHREDSYYLRLLGLKISELAQSSAEEDLRIETFLETIDSPIVKKLFSSDFDMASSRITSTYGITRSSRKKFQRSSRVLTRFFLESKGLALIEEYVKFFCTSSAPLVNIENFQNIDDYSLNYLLDMLRGRDGIYMLLEYTEGDEHGWSIEHLYEELKSTRASVEKMRLYKMSPDDAMRLLGERSGALEDYLRRAYSISDGNLRPLVDIEVLRNEQDKHETVRHCVSAILEKKLDLDHATIENINTLPQEQKLVLCLVAAHGGSVPWGYLSGIYDSKSGELPIWDLESTAEGLRKRKLVVFDDTNIRLSQDRVLHLVKNNSHLEKYFVLAYSFWRDHYEEIFSSGGGFFQSRADQAVMLLICYIELCEETRIIPLLSTIARVALESRSARQLCHYIDVLQRAVTTEGKSKAFLDGFNVKISRLFYLVGLYDRALEALDRIEDLHSREMITLRSSLLVLNHRHQEALEYVSAALTASAKSQDSSFYLTMKLIELSSLRCINRHKECSRLFRSLMSEVRFQDCPEYGYLLRSAQIASLDDSETVKYMRSSIDFFQQRKDAVEEARGRVSITLELCNLGLLEEADRHLERAEGIFSEMTIERHCLFNNMAGVKIYKGEFDSGTITLLRTAKATSSDPFTRLIINSNLLIVLSLCRRLSDAEFIISAIEEILDSGQPPDLEIRRIANYNLALHYRNMGHAKIADKYMDRAKSIELDFWADRWKKKLYDPYYVNPGYRVQVPHQFEPTFLSYWTVQPVKDVG